MKEHEFWSRVDELLDERRDPLDDETVQRHLARDPRAMDEYVRLTATLASLPSRRPKRRATTILAAAGFLAAAVIAYALLGPTPRAEPEVVSHGLQNPGAAPEVRSTSASMILDFKISVVRQSGPLRCTTTIEADRRTDERELTVAAGAESPLANATLTTVRHRGLLP